MDRVPFSPRKFLTDELGIGSLSSAVGLLEDYVLPTSPDDAVDYLDFFAEVFRILDLYRYYYPQEYAKSTASIVLGKDVAYCEREIEFFTLLNDRRFPVPWFMLDTDLTRSERVYDIPIEARGREWEDADLDEWEPGWLLLLWLLGELSQEDVLEHHPTLDTRVFDLDVKRGRLALAGLLLHIRTIEGPLRHLPTALCILWHDTGCWYLDMYQEQPQEHGELGWSRGNIDLASEQALLYATLSRQADECIEWIGEDILSHFGEVIALWNQYLIREQENHFMLFNHPPVTLE